MNKGYVVIALLPLLFTVACEKVELEGTKERTPKNGMALQLEGQLSTGTVELSNASGERVNVSVEIASTEEARTQGLQHRESLAENTGMWFVFPEEAQGAFHTRNMKFPIDLLFVDSEGKITHIVKHASPDASNAFMSDSPFKAVLEVNAGFAELHQIDVGDHARLRLGPAS